MTIWRQESTVICVQCNAEGTKCPLRLSAKEIKSNELPFESCISCSVHWALRIGLKGLTVSP